jgi:hypothetical protein
MKRMTVWTTAGREVWVEASAGEVREFVAGATQPGIEWITLSTPNEHITFRTANIDYIETKDVTP